MVGPSLLLLPPELLLLEPEELPLDELLPDDVLPPELVVPPPELVVPPEEDELDEELLPDEVVAPEELLLVETALAPVPDRLTDCGEPAALSAMLIVPVRVPVAVGLNCTLRVHFAPSANVVPQVVRLPKTKSPEIAKGEEKVRAAVPVLVMVTNWAALVVPTVWLAKVSVDGERLIAGAEAAPTMIVVVVMAEPPALSHARMVIIWVPALRVSVPLSVLLVDVSDVATPLS